MTYLPADGTRICAVDDLDLTCAAGEIVGILGESGCGKSTLANAILQLLPRHALCEPGHILFRGNDLSKMAEPELCNIRGLGISLVPQDPALSLNPVIKVGLQIEEVLRAHLPLRAKERRGRVHDLLCEVGFNQPDEISSAYPHQLSGGQRQRIAIAQAIACKPALLIADEPTSKLDAPLQAEIIALLAQIRLDHGIAIVIISHDPALFAGFTDRIAVMYAGRIVESGVTSQIFREPLHPYAQVLVELAKSTLDISAPQPRRRFAAISGDLPNPTDFHSGCRFYPRCPERMEICDQRDPQAFLPLPSRPVRCFKYGE